MSSPGLHVDRVVFSKFSMRRACTYAVIWQTVSSFFVVGACERRGRGRERPSHTSFTIQQGFLACFGLVARGSQPVSGREISAVRAFEEYPLLGIGQSDQ